jgi:hypothetical protein
MIYQTFYSKDNPKAEYQRRGGVWYKRAIGTNEVFVPVANEYQQHLESTFKKKFGILFQYSTQAKIGAVVLLIGGYIAYRKFLKKNGISKL